ncbi:g6f-like isoform X1 [Epinephelus lanceolatus]|uniref:g6f-like isoform X1 n=1 Tax=Epinephelus lanceolatus TaxID=310571 RepID=UPI0014486C5C|nr:g6f-like isoform X1 [Epinephelus lanceolatus]
MESGFLAVILVSSFAVNSSHSAITDWEDVVVAREGMPTTLVCTDTVRGAVAINWMVKSLGADDLKLVLSASETNEFSGGASRASMQLSDPNFQDTGVFSLSLVPTMEDIGLYSCLIKQQERKLKEKIILLAILTVTVVPAAPIPQQSTLRLIACVNPPSAAKKITWAAPGGIPIKSETKPNTGTVAKLPQVQNSDNGAYVCMVHPWGNSSSALFPFNVEVTVDADNVASFTSITHESEVSTATQAQTPFLMTCPGVVGDFVRLHWLPPDRKRATDMKLVYEYDRWRDSTILTAHSKKLMLAGPPYNAEAGSFAFLLTPGLQDGGLYVCDVFQNDNAFSNRVTLSVLKVKISYSSSKLELGCLYSERSQVQSAVWKYQNKSRRLELFSNRPGSITTTLALPIAPDTAGNYTCILRLKNGRTVWATQAVTLPHEAEKDVKIDTPSLLPFLSALLLLVPLVAVAVCVLLWRQKHISDRGIEQSLSVHSGEAENIYENPEDVRQAPPQGSVYMDLKPRGEDDVYKELERY